MEYGSDFSSDLGNLNYSDDNIFAFLKAYNVLCFDSGRSATRYLLQSLKHSIVALPDYLCESIVDCFTDSEVYYYSINEKLQISDIENIPCADEWNRIVKSFSNWDIYYLYEYTESMARHGDGKQFLFYFKGDKSRMCYPVHIKDVASFPAFRGALPQGVYFDISTPYGYGGPLVEGDFDEKEQEAFDKPYREFCRGNHIVTQFVRYHPLLQNQYTIAHVSETADIKETIAIDTTDKDLIFNNMDSKNRNMIRKAEKSGVEIFLDDGEHLDDFIRIYELTMTRLEAKQYYFFERSYYEYLISHMGQYTKFFYARLNDEIISSSIFFYNEQFMHYHLSGTVTEYRAYAPTNLLLYQAALWANERGIKQLHLGGGTGIVDSLFNFKKQFNKNGHLPFWIGRTIIDRTAYDHLLDVRKELDPTFDKNNEYYIQYRK